MTSLTRRSHLTFNAVALTMSGTSMSLGGYLDLWSGQLSGMASHEMFRLILNNMYMENTSRAYHDASPVLCFRVLPRVARCTLVLSKKKGKWLRSDSESRSEIQVDVGTAARWQPRS